jgi:hypothetical protein
MLLFALLAGYAAALSSGDEAYVQMRELWSSKHAFVQRIMSYKAEPNARTFHTLDAAANQACQLAEQAFFTLAQTCLPQVDYIFNNSNTAPASQVATDIGTFCAPAACNSQLLDAVAKLDLACMKSQVWQTECPKAPASNCSSAPYPCALVPGTNTCGLDPAFLKQIRFVLNLFCLQGPDGQGGTKFCVPSFYGFVNPNPSCPLQTRLQNGCDLCTLKIFALWSSLEPLAGALNFMQLGLECLNLKNTWCAIHQMDMQTAADNLAKLPNGGNCNTFPNATSCAAAARGCRWNTNNNPPNCDDDYTGTTGQAKLDTICHPCTGAYIWRMVVIIGLEDQLKLPDNASNPRDAVRDGLLAILFVRSGICATDLQDNYCQPQLQTANPNFSGDPCVGLGQLVAKTGCCTAGVVAFEYGLCQIQLLAKVNTTCATDLQNQVAVLQNCASRTPPVVLGPTCAEIKFAVLVKLTVIGLDAIWLADVAHQTLLLDIIARIVAYNGGVNASAVATQGAATNRRLLAAGSYAVTATVTVGSAADYLALNSGLSKTSNLETLDLNQNTQAGGVAPVQVTSSGVNPVTSSATKAVGSIVAALAVAFGALFA